MAAANSLRRNESRNWGCLCGCNITVLLLLCAARTLQKIDLRSVLRKDYGVTYTAREFKRTSVGDLRKRLSAHMGETATPVTPPVTAVILFVFDEQTKGGARGLPAHTIQAIAVRVEMSETSDGKRVWAPYVSSRHRVCFTRRQRIYARAEPGQPRRRQAR
jgi:hypothetical protein